MSNFGGDDLAWIGLRFWLYTGSLHRVRLNLRPIQAFFNETNLICKKALNRFKEV